MKAKERSTTCEQMWCGSEANLPSIANIGRPRSKNHCKGRSFVGYITKEHQRLNHCPDVQGLEVKWQRIAE